MNVYEWATFLHLTDLSNLKNLTDEITENLDQLNVELAQKWQESCFFHDG